MQRKSKRVLGEEQVLDPDDRNIDEDIENEDREEEEEVTEKKSRSKGEKNEVERSRTLSDEENALHKLLKKSPKSLTWLSNTLSMPKTGVTALADRLAKKGYDVRFKDRANGERIIFLNTEENIELDSFKIEEASRKIRIAVISGPRFGLKQSQVSLLRWAYEEDFEKHNINCVLVLGELVAGKPTETSLVDYLPGLEDPEAQVEYAVKHMPRSNNFKTYILGGRRELSMRSGEGFDVIRAICSAREDLVAAGELERTFDFHGVTLRGLCPWDDNSPKTLSYGVEKILKTMDPIPDIAVFGGMGQRQEIPCDGPEQKTLAITVPSFHTQTRRESKKGINPRLGYTIIELDFDEGVEERKIDLAKNVHVHHINLDQYAVKNDWAKGVDDVDLSKVLNGGRLVMEWLLKEKDGAISAGELTRRLAAAGHNKSKQEVKELIGRLCAGGANIQWRTDEKRFRLVREHKDQFKAPAMKYEDVFAPLTKAASKACTHLDSKQEMPEVWAVACDEAMRDGVRAFFHAGDVTDGPGRTGYRGHINDVKHVGVDNQQDHCWAVFPRPGAFIEATPERPLERGYLHFDKEGKFYYEIVKHTDGKFTVQFFIINGNHDEWGVTDNGYSPVRGLALRMPGELVYLGQADGSITIDGSVIFDGVFNRLTHGGGGIGTLSAKVQKFIAAHRAEGLGRGLPTVLHLGNWHTAYMLFQDEVAMLDACFKYKDAFHVRLGLVSKVGLYVYELFGDKKKGNITRAVMNFRNYRPLANQMKNKTVK
ncbi:MAG: hypothetical protein HY226_01690 [Candidatus Vogelbacteria bacterium]|nr:hypothetical protein [Candidatus Vogelbacteria bacterium]